MPASRPPVAVIGGGPAGLMAAEVLARAGAAVDLYDAMPSVGRKFLLAGRGGLNLTHTEDFTAFLSRYGERAAALENFLQDFGPQQVRDWAHNLGIATFVGSSQRVFPTDMKAAPLLRAWLHQLRAMGVGFHMRHRWLGWTAQGELRFATPEGERSIAAAASVLALGGASWARLGSDGAWVAPLRQQGVEVRALRAANCGFDIAWSEHFRGRFAGQPVKAVVASFTDAAGREQRRQGEFVVTGNGVEGSLIYALSAGLRDAIESRGSVDLRLDLVPGRERERLERELARPRGARSLASHLQGRIGIGGVKAGLLREVLRREEMEDPARLAAMLKALPLRLAAARPIEEAISSAGGVAFEALDPRLMLHARPGVFCAGEMLDWEAPTGGYLLTACLASGAAAGAGAAAWVREQDRSP